MADLSFQEYSILQVIAQLTVNHELDEASSLVSQLSDPSARVVAKHIISGGAEPLDPELQAIAQKLTLVANDTPSA